MPDSRSGFARILGELSTRGPVADGAGVEFVACLRSHYSGQQLIAEGYKVCEAIHHGGMTDMQAIDMVENDLAVSSSAAIDVYTAATIGLGC